MHIQVLASLSTVALLSATATATATNIGNLKFQKCQIDKLDLSPHLKTHFQNALNMIDNVLEAKPPIEERQAYKTFIDYQAPDKLKLDIETKEKVKLVFERMREILKSGNINIVCQGGPIGHCKPAG